MAAVFRNSIGLYFTLSVHFLTATAFSGEAVCFETDVIPLLTRHGCNSGACHGAAIGRGGFRLSLYGSRPDQDYDSLVREIGGRRIDAVRPDQSLVVLKPTEQTEHGGGLRFSWDSPSSQMLEAWISQEARRGPVRKLERLDVVPRRSVPESPGEQVRLTATAFFSDGVRRDVSSMTVWTADDPAAVEISSSEAGTFATVLRRGRHLVTARYLSRVIPIELIVPAAEASAAVTTELLPRQNFIDDEIRKALTELRLPSSAGCSDAEFERRVTLDLTGRLPISAPVRLADSGDRQQFVEGLLGSDEFNEYWTLQLAKLLRVRPSPNDDTAYRVYHAWIREQLAAGTGYDQLVRQLILGQGDTHLIGPANYYRTEDSPGLLAEFTSEVFMGTRLRCANCHDHPLDHWTQDDYHGLAAVFARIRAGKVVRFNPGGRVIHPGTLEPAIPRIPGDADPYPEGHADLRQFAEWLTSAGNPYFAEAIVNRLWKHMMGRGLVEPVDDFRSTNPATHPALLKRLAEDFVAEGYDLRRTLRVIAGSAVYAASTTATEGNRHDDRYWSHGLRRPLPPEVLADAVSDVLGVPESYGDLPRGTRAVSLVNPATPSESLDILGRCGREESCESSAGRTGGQARTLHLLNGPLLNSRLRAEEGRLAQLLRSGAEPLECIAEFYQAALNRSASPAEVAFWEDSLVGADDKDEWLSDFVWSLLTCDEFVTNH